MFRIGHGFDLHQLEPVDKEVGITISQITIPFHSKAKAHSDGDVVFHAVIDAMLGALALGDIGQWFPDNDPKYKGASSHTMLQDVLKAAEEMSYAVMNVDVTIIAEQPKLKNFIPMMRQQLAESLRVELPQISIKAKTHEQVDAIGEGKALAAHAVLMMQAIKVK